MVKPDLKVRIGRLKLKNPVMAASGTFGFGEEFKDFVNINKLGAIITKSITLKPREGNPPPRIVETASGILNSIGLQNDGIENFLKEKVPLLRKAKTVIVVSIAGESFNEYKELTRRLDKIDMVDAIEINISCPNVKGGLEFAVEPNSTFDVVTLVRRNTGKVLITKLSPNVKDMGEIAKAAEEAGTDSVSLVNTFTGIAVDIQTKTSKLGNVVGGLSGPAIKPIALRMVWEVTRQVKIPVIGMGGVMDYKDALEFIIAGASAVQVGTASFVNPKATIEIIDGIERYMSKNKIKDMKGLIGCLRV
ncbi:MAG: hypothetical protein AMJ78_02995 [Omnitrophica WOR_2 bacterium SM23_29]|nr:MAG: hypothetical protein AMJ78_02995 [Omnitrophica WOR_2 bacterium SM23_29]